ncbi:ABC transporter permease [Lacticaseibacillus mingshuiensis]|uniref:ABC transporter permease n=1 Tax=Lacticaseibacillus mingshuiensis TaxID=2799574 RepID=A0ABW4CHP5_9LACO|nr:ABC transporter permease [Lacticaseibacillus mingshuiensis]
MGILTKLSLRSLREEKSRTILTIVAMTIAATLAVATLVGLRSVQISMYQRAVQSEAGLVVRFPGVTAEKAEKLQNSSQFSKTAAFEEVGESQLTGMTDQQDSGVQVYRLTAKDLKLMATPILAAGRLPQTSDEILVPSYAIGDGSAIGQRETVHINGQKRRLLVVGTIDMYAMSPIAGNSLVMLTKTLTGKRTVMVAPASFGGLHARMSALAKTAGIHPKTVTYDESALMIMGASGNAKSQAILVSVVLAALLVIGGVALIMIYMSINLTVKAHRERYGLLRSLGTTPKQLRRLVYEQSLTLALPALLFGYLFGIFGIKLTMTGINQMMRRTQMGFTFVFRADWLPLVIAGLFMAGVTLLAAARPAFRASRISPIAAIRTAETSPMLSRWRLHETWLMRHLHTLALKRDRRNTARGTMLVLLTLTVALFIGMTGFMHNLLANTEQSRDTDLMVAITGSDQRTAVRKLITQQAKTKQLAVVLESSAMVLKEPYALTDSSMTVVAVPDAQFKKNFNSTPTYLNTRVQGTDANGKNHKEWLVPPTYDGTYALGNADHMTKKAGVTTQATLVPATEEPGLAQLIYHDGFGAMIVSETLFAQWQAKLGNKASDMQTVAAVKLSDPQDHKALVKALSTQFKGSRVTDYIAYDEQNIAIMTAFRVISYGFITLLALVSLATIINHVFAALLEQKRSLAMLQSIGTTSGQLTGMLNLQNALLLVKGGVLGTLLGNLLSYWLYRLMTHEFLKSFLWPWQETLAALLGLAVIWLAFAITTRRMLRHQDIDQLIRAV